MGVTKTVSKDAANNIKEQRSVKEDAARSITGDIPVEKSSTHDANLTTPSQESDITATTERTAGDGEQPGHLKIEDELPVPKEAWQTPATDSTSPDSKEESTTTASKETVKEPEDKVPEKGGMKVEDLEDEQQEIMEYVAVLEEEEQDKEVEDEERYCVLSVR